MSNREEFEKWWLSQKWSGMAPLDKWGVNLLALDVWQARQPEIDALKKENAVLKEEIDMRNAMETR